MFKTSYLLLGITCLTVFSLCHKERAVQASMCGLEVREYNQCEKNIAIGRLHKSHEIFQAEIQSLRDEIRQIERLIASQQENIGYTEELIEDIADIRAAVPSASEIETEAHERQEQEYIENLDSIRAIQERANNLRFGELFEVYIDIITRVNPRSGAQQSPSLEDVQDLFVQLNMPENERAEIAEEAIRLAERVYRRDPERLENFRSWAIRYRDDGLPILPYPLSQISRWGSNLRFPYELGLLFSTAQEQTHSFANSSDSSGLTSTVAEMDRILRLDRIQERETRLRNSLSAQIDGLSALQDRLKSLENQLESLESQLAEHDQNTNRAQLIPGRYSRARYFISIFQRGERYCYLGLSRNGSTLSSLSPSQAEPGSYLIDGFNNNLSVYQLSPTTIRFGDNQVLEREGEVRPFNQLDSRLQACLTSTEAYSHTEAF